RERGGRQSPVGDRHAAHRLAGASVDRDVVHHRPTPLLVVVGVEPHREVHRHPAGAVHREPLGLPPHAAVVPVDRAAYLRPGDREQLVLEGGDQRRDVTVAAFGGVAGQVAGVPLDGVLRVEREDGVDDVVGVDEGVHVRPLAGGLQGQVVDGEVDAALDAVDVGVVDRALVVAGAPGVAARLDLPDPAHLAGRVAVDHHVGQVDTDDVLGGELRDELPVGEAPPFAGEGLDVFDRLVAGDAEREYGVGNRPV